MLLLRLQALWKLGGFCRVKKFSLFLLPFFLALTIPFSSPAFSEEIPYQKVSSVRQEHKPVTVDLLSEEDSINPGRSFWVGVRLKMDKGWDTYWVNPGDSGFPTKVTWHVPDGFNVGPLNWPYPEKFSQETLTAYGYTDSVLLLAEVTPPKNISVGQKVNI